MKFVVDLVLPTPDLVVAAASAFDQKFALAEKALSDLKCAFPQNVDQAHILLKVVTLNRLYSAQVYAVETMAEHIFQLRPELDAALATGESAIVDTIASVVVAGGKTRNFFSFATKYCSWHNPDAYPIYDSRVYDYLWKLEKHTKKLDFRDSEVWDYARFKQVMTRLQTTYGLEGCSFKSIDKFLWLAGETNS